MKLGFITNNAQTHEEIVQFIKEWENDLPYFESKTSGSTGTPKVIRINKEHARSSAAATIDFLGIKPGDRALLCLNIQTIGGKMMVVRSIEHQLELIVEEPTSNPLKNFEETIDFIAIAPIQLATILKEDANKLRSIRSIIVGGGVISSELVQALIAEKITVYQTFGMTETISHIAMRKVGFESEQAYRAMSGVTFSSINQQLVIHAPAIGQPRLETNDLVELINEKQFTWLGRADFVINSGGIKIQMEELEAELRQHIPFPLFVYKSSDEKLGEKVVLIVNAAVQANLLYKNFYSFLKNRYHIPKLIAFTANFILTPSDKINRLATFKLIENASFRPLL